MKLGSEEIFYINAFNRISGATARDVVVQGNNVAFLVKQGDIGRAIGKNACNVKALGKRLGKNVEIIEHREKLGEFVKKALYNVKVSGVEISESGGKKKAFVSLESGEKKKLLNNLGRFKRVKEIARRNYELNELRIK
jgi:N utilization substance protein A